MPNKKAMANTNSMAISIATWRDQASQKFQVRMALLVFVLLMSMLLGLTQGALSINLTEELNALEQAVLWDIRLPRMLMTVATGAGLAICGLVLQALTRNPLADPGIIGVSTFSALFASIAILISTLIVIPQWLGSTLVPAMAFFGAALSLFLLMTISGYKQSMNTLVLVLTGVALNAGAATLLGLVIYLADDETLRVITFWQMGSYSGIHWYQALLACFLVSLTGCYFYRRARPIMLLQMGEQHARFQGIDADKLKRILLACVAVVTAICVCFTGIVGFIGLVVPHIARMLVGANLKILIPTSMIAGASLVTLADMCARLLVVPAELPIGLLTSALGVPFFLGLILREKKKFTYD